MKKKQRCRIKVLHKTIKKIEEDTERFSFNTGVSTFMICVNDLTDLKCYKKEVLEQLLILLLLMRRISAKSCGAYWVIAELFLMLPSLNGMISI
jgi:leucyl-tRNA synthetase